MAFPILEVLGMVFKPIVDLIDDLTLSPEEKAKLQAEVTRAQFEMYGKALDMERAALEARAKIVAAEAASSNWLTASWRPILMLTFGGLVVARWLGFTTEVPPEVEAELWTVVQIGIGGYVVGRSAEKVVPALAAAMTKDKS
jgi:hypothetical protein